MIGRPIILLLCFGIKLKNLRTAIPYSKEYMIIL